VPRTIAVVRGTTRDPWPASLLLDELWLKVRRLSIDELARRELWLATEEFHAARAERRRCGRRLRAELLAPALGAQDFQQLRSTAAFDSPDGRLFKRLPLMLAFGYDIGAGLVRPDRSELRNGGSESEIAHQVGCLCALFNCGIALFDALYDRLPQRSHELSQALDIHLLRAAMHERTHLAELAHRAGAIQALEPRIVMRVVTAFYERLWSTAACDRTAPQWQALDDLLAEAYNAEMMSVIGEAAGAEALQTAATAKAVLPFQVMAALATVCAPPTAAPVVATAGEEREPMSTARQVGTVFSLVDDLIDLVHDTEAGAVNTIALRVSASEPHLLPRRLLEGCEVDQAVAELGANVSALVNRCRACGAENLADTVILNLQNWVIGDRGDLRAERRRLAAGLTGAGD
jgi:hypothetical protein